MIRYRRNSNGSWNKEITHMDDILVEVNNDRLIELDEFMKMLNINAEIELEEDKLRVVSSLEVDLERLLQEHWKMIYNNIECDYDWFC